jgi:hypothetical protein
MYEASRTDGGARLSTLLAQVRYDVVPGVAMRRQSRRRMWGSERTEALVCRPCWRRFAMSCRMSRLKARKNMESDGLKAARFPA